jgi:hypothetical protein
MLYTKYQEAVISSCWDNCNENFLPFTINFENVTKSKNRNWMSYRPEIEPHGMGPRVNVILQISKGCDKNLPSDINYSISLVWTCATLPEMNSVVVM